MRMNGSGSGVSYIAKQDLEEMKRERVRLERTGAPTWSGRLRRYVPALASFHLCTWALCHVHRADFGHETLGAVKPVLECVHGLTSKTSQGVAERLYAVSQREILR